MSRPVRERDGGIALSNLVVVVVVAAAVVVVVVVVHLSAAQSFKCEDGKLNTSDVMWCVRI